MISYIFTHYRIVEVTILFIFVSISSKKHFFKLSFICEVIIFILAIREINYSYNDLLIIFLMVIVGYAISPLIIFLTFGLTNFAIPKIKLTFTIELSTYLQVLWEELIWRYALIATIFPYITDNVTIKIVIVLLSTFLFIYSHDFGSFRDKCEMYLYALILMISYIFVPGLNLGLHIGRNTMCAAARNEEK